jgi:hypothetical protein
MFLKQLWPSLGFYFPHPMNKNKFNMQIGGGLLITTHLNPSF